MSVYALDHRGHGCSSGKQGAIDRFEQYGEDLRQFVHEVHKMESGKKLFLIGHSMGGLIVISYLLSGASEITGVILSSPLLGISLQGAAIKKALSRILSLLIPHLSLFNEVEVSDACRDPEIVRQTLKDPLMHQRITPRLYMEMLRTMKHAWKNVTLIHHPLLLLQAGEDKIVDRKKAILFAKKTSSHDKTIKVYEGFHHEVFNDIERHRVFEDMAQWLSCRG